MGRAADEVSVANVAHQAKGTKGTASSARQGLQSWLSGKSLFHRSVSTVAFARIDTIKFLYVLSKPSLKTANISVYWQ